VACDSTTQQVNLMFQERPALKVTKKKSLVYGVGINDAPYVTTYMAPNGSRLFCPYFQVWRSMIQRCYYTKYHLTRPTYQGCSVESSWHLFTTFRAWMEQQDWQGKVLDKDLLKYGNRIYAPDTCVFLPQHLNALLTLRGNARGLYPLGVSRVPGDGKTKPFIAQLRTGHGQKVLGYYQTPEEAAYVYRKAKLAYIAELASVEPNPRIKQALLALH
jgi:hypothetical protein